MDYSRSPAPIPPWHHETRGGPWPSPGQPLTLSEFSPAPLPPRRRGRPWLNLLLFLLTIGSTTFFGALHYEGFALAFEPGETQTTLWHGLWYSVTILAILGAHEFGHYYACRYYRVDASIPYFLPAPFLTGTLGAFIRIREPIPTKRMLFDIGVAGPIAGFVVAVPALFIGLSLSLVLPVRTVPIPAEFIQLDLGHPLLYQFAIWLTWGGELVDGYQLYEHPMVFAAWFGLIATALNLFPISQLDGGHISYAALGSRSTLLTLSTALIVVALAFYSTSWILWAALMVLMLVTFGPRHPRTLDHHVPLDRTRLRVALFALFMFVVCFTPAPIEIVEVAATP